MTFGLGLRNWRRIRKIVAVALKYGLGSLFEQVDLGRFLPLSRRRRLHPKFQGMSSARRLRLALAELGPAFIKLGQVLSARSDLLPPDFIQELRHLQDEGPTVPFDQIRGVIEADLGMPLARLFAHFEEAPVSSASFGQVHAAVLYDGQQVMVKVLRPGVEEVVRQDLQIFSDIATLLDRQSQTLHYLDLPGLVRQLIDQIENELVYTIEAHSSERVRKSIHEHTPSIYVPEVIWSLTSRHVLTVERVYGHRADRIEDFGLTVDRPRLARELGHFILHQIFVDGFFHGDPHQGNVLITEDGRMALLDFGIVGYLDPRLRVLLAEVVRRFDGHDVEAMLNVVTEIGSPRPEADLVSLRDGLARLVSRSEILPRREFTVGELLSRTIRVMWLSRVRVPMELSLAARALAVGEGVCLDIDPGFSFRDVSAEAVAEARERAASLDALLARASSTAEVAVRQLSRVPSRLSRVLSVLERGAVRLRIDDPEGDRVAHNVARSINRLALSVLSASLFLAGTAFVMLTKGPAHSTVGIVTMAAGAAVGGIVVMSVFRPGRL